MVPNLSQSKLKDMNWELDVKKRGRKKILVYNIFMSKNATQEFVPIDDVRDGIVIMKNGGMRGILMASSINFSLKSDDERQAILLQFQDF